MILSVLVPGEVGEVPLLHLGDWVRGVVIGVKDVVSLPDWYEGLAWFRLSITPC